MSQPARTSSAPNRLTFEPGEVVVVRQLLAGDDLRGPGAPAEDDADLVELVAEAAREEERAESEAREQLRQLGRVSEAVRFVAGGRRLDAEAATDAPPEQQVPHE